jgi:hypothetical protein
MVLTCTQIERFFAPLRMTSRKEGFGDFGQRSNCAQTSPRLGFAMFGFQAVEHQEPFVGVLVAIHQNSLVVLDFEDSAGDFAPLALAEPWQLLDDFGFTHETSNRKHDQREWYGQEQKESVEPQRRPEAKNQRRRSSRLRGPQVENDQARED